MGLIALWLVITGTVWAAAALGRATTVREPARGLALDLALAFGIAMTLSTFVVLAYAFFRRSAA